MADPSQTISVSARQEEYWECVCLLIEGGHALIDSEWFDRLATANWKAVNKRGKIYAQGQDHFMHRADIPPSVEQYLCVQVIDS